MNHKSIPTSSIPAANVRTVPLRSPLRYPGGKTWLIPHIRKWLGASGPPAPLLVEPFAGGGIVSLTALMESLADRAVMAELDSDVAAFWRAALHHGPSLVERVLSFSPTRGNVEALSCAQPRNVIDRGFRALVLNRTRHGGILAAGAALTNVGESGRGIGQRWYPKTIADRLSAISEWRGRICFCETDGVALLDGPLGRSPDVAVFVDPPYTASSKRPGARLYTHHSIDHIKLFSVLADSGANFLMTYDASPEVAALIERHGFSAVQVTTGTTRNTKGLDLVITPAPLFSPKP